MHMQTLDVAAGRRSRSLQRGAGRLLHTAPWFSTQLQPQVQVSPQSVGRDVQCDYAVY